MALGRERKCGLAVSTPSPRVLRALRPSPNRMLSTKYPEGTGQGGPFRPLSSGILPFLTPTACPSSPQSCWLGWGWGVGAVPLGLPELWALTMKRGEAEARRRQGGWRGRSICHRSRWVCSPRFTDVPGGQDRGAGRLGHPWAAGSKGACSPPGRGWSLHRQGRHVLTEPHSHQVRPECALSPFYGGQQRAREEGKPLPRLPAKGDMVELGFSQGLSLCNLLGKPSQRLFQC